MEGALVIEMKASLVTVHEISLELPNRSRIVGPPGTEPTVRGFSAVSLLLLDDASRVSEDLYLAIRPMLAVSDGMLGLMSTPLGKQGFFYETWAHGGPEWERFRAPATECSRIRKAYLAEELATMGERWFRREYLCEFDDTVSGVFTAIAVLERAETKGAWDLVMFAWKKVVSLRLRYLEQIAAELEHGPDLVKEMAAMQVKITLSGHEQYAV